MIILSFLLRFSPFQILIAGVNNCTGNHCHQKSAQHICRKMHTQIQSGQCDQRCQHNQRDTVFFRQHPHIDERTGKRCACVPGGKRCLRRDPSHGNDRIRIVIGPHTVHQRFQRHIRDQEAQGQRASRHNPRFSRLFRAHKHDRQDEPKNTSITKMCNKVPESVHPRKTQMLLDE